MSKLFYGYSNSIENILKCNGYEFYAQYFVLKMIQCVNVCEIINQA